MSTSPADLLLHPIRLRIIVALTGQQLTVQQLAGALPDVPQATLYRQIHKLVQGDVVTVVATRPVRGTLEKVYTLRTEIAHVTPEQFAAASRGEHMRYFASFVASLLGDFAAYLRQEPISLLTDGVGYTATPMYVSDDELATLQAGLRNLLLPLALQAPGPGRRRRTLSLVLIPAPAAPSNDYQGEG